MTIHQIECFLEAARTLNFTEAANHLYISQQGVEPPDSISGKGTGAAAF